MQISNSTRYVKPRKELKSKDREMDRRKQNTQKATGCKKHIQELKKQGAGAG